MSYEDEFMGAGGGIPPNFDYKEFMKNLTDDQLLQLVKTNPELSKQYDNIIKNQLQGTTGKAVSSAQYLQIASKIDPYLDPEGGIMIQPSPGFVLKSFELNSNQKVFINIVEHEIVDEPEQKMLVDYENQPGLRIPMSVGRVKESHDKKGEICKVVDVVLNPRVIQATQKDEGLLLFLFEILQNYLYEKYKIMLNEKFTRFKELNYKGSAIEAHRVKGKKAPKIHQMSEEVTKSSEQQKKEEQLFESLNNTKSKAQQPKFRIFTSLDKKQLYDLDSHDIENIIIEFQLPLLIHSKGILLEGNQQIIHLLVKGLYEICLRLPVRGEKLEARFIKNRRVLEVQLARKVEVKVEQGAPESKPISVSNGFAIESDLLYDLV